MGCGGVRDNSQSVHSDGALDVGSTSSFGKRFFSSERLSRWFKRVTEAPLKMRRLEGVLRHIAGGEKLTDEASSNEKGWGVYRKTDDDGVCVVTVWHPPVNAMSSEVLARLLDVLKEAEEDRNVKAVVLEGAAGKFVAGADIKEMEALDRSQARLPALSSPIEHLNAVGLSSKPIVAAICSFALGGGLELAMLCAGRVTHHTARLGLPELTLGILPGWGGTQRLPRLVGVEKALSMMLTSKPVTGSEAFALGLVDAVCEQPSQVLERAKELARALAAPGAAKRVPVLFRTEKLENGEMIVEMATQMTRKQLGKADVVHPLACLECVRACVQFAKEPLKGLMVEREQSLRCVAHPAFAALRGFFLAQKKCAKEVKGTARPVQDAVIVGAGKMGAGIAAVFAHAGIR